MTMDTDTGQSAQDEFQAAREDVEGRLQNGMAELGYPANAGPEDADTVDKALFAIGGLQTTLEKTEQQRDAAIARAEKAEKATKRAKAKISQGETPAKPRKLGPVTRGEDAPPLLDAIHAAETVEIAFSDGKAEVPGLAPIRVEGNAWREHSLHGLMLDEAVTLTGPATGSSVMVKGYALLIDGQPAAYTERTDPLAIAPGRRVELRDDIYFG
jgi:hypothetical protein